MLLAGNVPNPCQKYPVSVATRGRKLNRGLLRRYPVVSHTHKSLKSVSKCGHWLGSMYWLQLHHLPLTLQIGKSSDECDLTRFAEMSIWYVTNDEYKCELALCECDQRIFFHLAAPTTNFLRPCASPCLQLYEELRAAIGQHHRTGCKTNRACLSGCCEAASWHYAQDNKKKSTHVCPAGELSGGDYVIWFQFNCALLGYWLSVFVQMI